MPFVLYKSFDLDIICKVTVLKIDFQNVHAYLIPGFNGLGDDS